MSKVLLIIAGVLNAAFVLFHLKMGWSLHVSTALPARVSGLLQTFNAGSALVLLFIAYVCLTLRKEMLSTGLGTAISTLGAAMYLTRAAEEFTWLGHNWIIAAVCLLLGLVHAALALSVRRVPQAA